MIDIDLLLDVLNKHNIDNTELANDLYELCNQHYLDGAFDREEDWWTMLDSDDGWISQHEVTKLLESMRENVEDVEIDLDKPLDEQPDSHIPGLPIDRNKDDG